MLTLNPTLAKTAYLDPDGRAVSLAHMSRGEAITAIQELQGRIVNGGTSSEFGNVQVNRFLRELSHARSRTVALTEQQFTIAECLIAARGAIVTHERFRDLVWGADCTNESTSDHILKVVVSRIRSKLRDADFPFTIKVAWGRGYYMAAVASGEGA